MAKFLYEGVTFETHARTAFENDTLYQLINDWLSMLRLRLGLEAEAEVSRAWGNLLFQLVAWCQVTEIEGELEGLPLIDIWIPNYNHLVQWRNVMKQHPDLYEQWRNAEAAANREEDNPLSETKEQNGETTSEKQVELAPKV